MCSHGHDPSLEHVQQRDPLCPVPLGYCQATSCLLPVSGGFCTEKGHDLIYIFVTIISFLPEYNKVPILFLD